MKKQTINGLLAKTAPVSFLLALLIIPTGCKDKKQTEEIITSRKEVQKPKEPLKIQAYADKKDVQWVGRTYTVEWKRTPDESLPMVKDETGQKYVDNHVSIRIVRSDGSVFFQRSFTKTDFKAYLTDQYNREGILEGMVFDVVNGNQLEFAASVSLPQSEDEYIPLKVKVDNFGSVAIERDNQLDTNGDEDDV